MTGEVTPVDQDCSRTMHGYDQAITTRGEHLTLMAK